MKFHCCDLRRLEVIRIDGSDNGIEFLEVLDLAAPDPALRQRTLFVRLLRAPAVPLTPDNLRISGGERIGEVGILWCEMAQPPPPPPPPPPSLAEPGLVAGLDVPALTLVIRTDGSGDHSTYTLAIVTESGSDQPPDGFDPILSSVQFSFKIECPNDFDCAPLLVCPPDAPNRPDIDYLAKDYQGFRRLMLDRLSLLTPGWTERSPADFGVALVELLAYAADNLSYRQDAIANEAYLATARQRRSIRRHARMVDYAMHEGCNARAFVHFEVDGQMLDLPQGTKLLTRLTDLGTEVAPTSKALDDALARGPLVFETAHGATLDERVNRLPFYAWGDNGCCLPRGSTRATLRGHHPPLEIGRILVFEEQYSPTTLVMVDDPEKAKADRDRTRRWAVRLTEVEQSTDPSGALFNDPAVDGPVDVTEIAWDAADALPFAFCVSVAERPGVEVSVALGNIVLADHGLTVAEEELGTMPEHQLELARGAPDSCCDTPEIVPVPPRFHPILAKAPVSHGFDLDRLLAVAFGPLVPWWPASSLLSIDPRAAMPRIAGMAGKLGVPKVPWEARRDLLASRGYDPHFVVEVDDNERAHLRFGDDQHGKRPDPGTAFTASYRFGNGRAGNVGADAIAHVVIGASGVFTKVRNPMAAAGGVDPEDVEAVRRDAPEAFRVQERAVTAPDYAAAAERQFEVQRAVATFRWTGSWHTVFVLPDRFGGGPIDAPFRARLRRHLERFRMAGYDLEISTPRFVPLDITLHVCVRSGYFRTDVLKRVAQVLSSAALPDGAFGLFHPDQLSFGEPVYLSRVIAAAQAVEGVESVQAERFQRLIQPNPLSLDQGVVEIGALEIAQLANNPSFPERGRLVLAGGGGK